MPRLWPLVVALLCCVLCAGQRCSRRPESLYGRVPPRTPGSGGYRLEVSGNHTKYDPAQRYEVKLVGAQNNKFVRKFEGFYLTVEPSVPADYGLPQHVGLFRPYSGSVTRFADECGPNTVKHSSPALKSYVALMWTAPPAGSGCVVFRATVIEGPAWFKDDGALSYELCERVRENRDQQPPTLPVCCACDEAKYEVTFEGLWSRNTHPRDFPLDKSSTAFSDIIGASHSAEFRFWEYGGLASEGVRQAAEWGDTKKLENELKEHSDQIRTIIKARGLEYPQLQSRTFAVFRVDRQHHQASLVSRIKPSPDWLVGVSAMELCLRNCSWAQRQVLNLRPWDAGTKNGKSYVDTFTPTNPRQKIQRITSKWPANSPFFDPTGAEIPPLARLVIQRQRVYERFCPAGAEPAGGATAAADSACATTRWGAWSACSVSCGSGFRQRRRHYRDRMQARMASCAVRLEDSGPCSTPIPCGGYAGYDYGGGGGGGGGGSGSGSQAMYSARGAEECVLTEWSPWTHCSATCGPGSRSRQRAFKTPRGHKRCIEKTYQVEDCTDQNEPCLEQDYIPPGCQVTPWSQWSPCSLTCGQEGFRLRTRKFLSQAASSDCDVKLEANTPCRPSRTDCRLARDEAVDICLQPMDEGDCRGSFERWYYSQEQGRCVRFTFSGCRGNDNKFTTIDECADTCEAVFDAEGPAGSQFGTTYVAPAGGGGGGGGAALFGSPQLSPGSDLSRHSEQLLSSSQVINPLLASGAARGLPAEEGCAVSAWGRWGPCSASCGRGTQVRRRQPLAGATGCGRRRLERHRECDWLPPC